MARDREKAKRGTWATSKPLAAALAVVIVAAAGFIYRGQAGTKVFLPGSYVCSECEGLTGFAEPPADPPPYECAHCGKRAAWRGYVCRNEGCPLDGKPYPLIPPLPEGVRPPAKGETPSPEYLAAVGSGLFPSCPACKANFTFQDLYRSPEELRYIEELKAKYK